MHTYQVSTPNNIATGSNTYNVLLEEIWIGVDKVHLFNTPQLIMIVDF